MSNVYLKVLSFLIATTICATNLPAQGNETDWVINLAPEECIMYLAWTGELSADENGAATEKWLAQKEIQSSIRALRDAIEIYLKANPANPMELNELARELPWLLMKQPFAVYLADLKMRKERIMPEFDKLDMGVVVDLGAKEKWMSNWIERMVAVVNENPNEQLEKQTIGDFSFYGMQKDELQFGFGINNGKFLMAFGSDAMKNLLKNLKSKRSIWLDSVLNQASPQRLAGVFHVNTSKFWEFANENPEAELPRFLHVEEIQSLSSVMEIRSDNLVTTSMIQCPRKTKGLLSVIDVRPLKASDIKDVPADVDTAYAFRFSIEKLWRLIKAGTSEFGITELQEAISGFEEETGLDFEKDVLNSFEGTFFSFANVDLMNPTGGTIISGKIKDPSTFQKHLESINDAVEDEIVYQGSGSYTTFESSGAEISVFEADFLNLCWCLVDDQLLMALDRSAIRTHLRKRKRKSERLVQQESIKQYFDGKIASGKQPIATTVVDLSSAIQVVLPSLGLVFGNRTLDPDFPFSMRDLPPSNVLVNGVTPNTSAVYRNDYGFKMIEQHVLPGNSSVALSGIGIGMLLPAVQAVRHAARRTTSANNIRQLLLSNLDYESNHGSFPCAYTKDESGKKLLSWRVHLLPYMDAGDLYSQFHLDEPWDSPHNKTLIEKMPQIFVNPALPLEKGMTTYLAVTGQDGILLPPKEASVNGEMKNGVTFAEVTDGSSNTLLVVDANWDHAVVWTKPDDFDPTEHQDIRAALSGTWNEELILAGRADGSITYLDGSDDDESIRQMMHKNDGKPIN